ncbi:hypothetical protein SZN_27226 [Streptomyces zinciresistens K42]|uniref:Serine aminopeptidase S33 domain-containing protein n=1 Tax=Streptomyces zinciresistens K42 TaxID=700597 RepID=G2GIV5_9ACTN|nr:alpha/beta hydrolase [Streptomyces zinciresistens]EGX56551.1 hypothetical protein SZN_27226 [Streptomyces zinciresistens K42]
MSELSDFTIRHDGELLHGVHGGDGGAATAVVLHGAGVGTTARLLPVVGEFVAHGCRGLAFDFSGHGESTGELRELSLRRRLEQAVAVIDARVPADGELILVGFSMSGQTVADLVGHYGARVGALGLCAPAVYAREAWDVPFGTGDGRFSEIIRGPGSWRGAPALDALRAYAGRAVLAVPQTDAVIPAAVTLAVQDALSARARFSRFDVVGAGHMLGRWFAHHGGDRREFVRRVLDGRGPGPLGPGVRRPAPR